MFGELLRGCFVCSCGAKHWCWFVKASRYRNCLSWSMRLRRISHPLISFLPLLVTSEMVSISSVLLIPCYWNGLVKQGNFHALLLFKTDEQLEVIKELVHRMVERAIALDGTCMRFIKLISVKGFNWHVNRIRHRRTRRRDGKTGLSHRRTWSRHCRANENCQESDWPTQPV